MPLEPKAQLVDPQGPLDVDGVNATGITTATGGFVGQVQGSATGLAATTLNITAGIITATRFIGDVTGTASSLAQGANITVGIMTATFVGDLIGNATGLSTTTSNLNLGIVTSTGFRGNFTGLSSGLSGTPNIQTGITTATKFIGNSTGTVVDLADDTNINVGIITATKFEGNTTGSVTDLADDTNINVGIITASKFIGNANGSVTGLADDTNINVATFTGTEFIGNSPGTAADLKSGTNLNVGTFTGTKFIGNTPGSATKLADDVNVTASTFTGTKFVGNTPGTVSDIADDTNLNMGTLTGTKFIGNATGSVSAISDDTNLNLGTLTASQFIGNTPGSAGGISAGKNLNAGTVTATTFYGSGANLTGASSPAYAKQNVTAQSGTTTINLNSGNVIYLAHDNNTTIAFSNVKTADDVTIIRSLTDKTITWPAAIKWNGATEPVLKGSNTRIAADQVFHLTTANGGTTWFAYEEVDSDPNTNTLFAWGSNANTAGSYASAGLLGQNNEGSPTNRSSPVQIASTKWTQITVNGSSAFGIKNDNTLYTWGNGSQGILGHNDTIYRSSPTQLSSTSSAWTKIFRSQGQYNAAFCARADGTTRCWGYNNHGQLGLGNRTSFSSPVLIRGDWDYITSDGYSSFGIKSDSTLWGWGFNGDGALGLFPNVPSSKKEDSVSSPVQMAGSTGLYSTAGRATGWVAVAPRMAVHEDGTLWRWGKGENGEGGSNNTDKSVSMVQVGSNTNWGQNPSKISTHTSLSAAIKTDGTLWTWGRNNNYGQLGVNDRSNRSSPIQIPGTTWSSIHVGGEFMRATKTDGTMWTWGRNDDERRGIFGQSFIGNRSSPTQIPGTDWSQETLGMGGVGATQMALKQSSFNQ